MNSYFTNLRTVSRCRRRRGSVYLAVVGVAMIVSIVGMAVMSIARLELKSTRNLQDMAEARLLSQSGVEFGLANMASLSDWRTERTHGVEMTPLAIGGGTMTYALVDDDGDLSDNLRDNVAILGIGRVGEAVHVTRAQLEPAGSGLTCLETSLHSGGDMTIDASTNLVTNQAVSSNGSILKINSGGIDGDAWAVGNVEGSVSGTKSENQSPPKEMPDAATVFDYYVANGTAIDYGSIAGAKIEKVVLSPGNNPYGSTTNALGIYVIDCQGNDMEIKDARICGTLVLLNAGSNTRIDKSICWEVVAANYPTLLVEGDLEMRWQGDQLLREYNLNVNFNPAGSPFQGIEDTDQLDEFPPMIKGLVYVSGNLTITDICILKGVVVVGGATVIEEAVTLTYDSALLQSPPPGFSAGTNMRIVPGTWARIPY